MAVNFVQSAFRIRGDRQASQGGTPSWYAAQNAVAVPTQQCGFRIRFQIENTGATNSTSAAWQLYASRNGGAYAAVTTITTFVQGNDASGGNSANNSAITSSLLTGGVTTFANGLYNNTGATTAQVLNAAGYTELEFGIIFTTSIVAADTYDFRVYNNNTPLNTYSQTPTLVPTKNIPDLVPTTISYDVATGQFSATIMNIGPGDTPVQCTVGCAFLVDTIQRSWGITDPDPTQIAAGATGTITSVGHGGPYTIPAGPHTMAGNANDSNNFAEVSTANNILTVPFPSLLGPVNKMHSWSY